MSIAADLILAGVIRSTPCKVVREGGRSGRHMFSNNAKLITCGKNHELNHSDSVHTHQNQIKSKAPHIIVETVII